MGRILISALTLSATLCSLQARAAPTVKVDQICTRAQRRAQRSPTLAQIFAAISAPETTFAGFRLDDTWQALARQSDLQALFTSVSNVADSALYNQAFAWDLPGNSLFVTTVATSSSGDWAHTVDYCFRADGSLALVTSTLSTVYGTALRSRTRRFLPNGRPLWVRGSLAHLSTGEARHDTDFRDQEEPIYLTRALLPFAHLINNPK